MFVSPVTKGGEGRLLNSLALGGKIARLSFFLGIGMKSKCIGFLLFLLFFCISSLGWAQDNQVQEKRLSPVADTFVSNSSRLTRIGTEREEERYVNFGTDGGLSVIRGKHARTGEFIHWRGSLIRFDLSEIPPDSEILEAKLFLYHHSVYGEQISIHRMLKNWTESGATWSEPCEGCEPWGQGWSEGNYVRSPTFSQRVTQISRWFSWDVTEDVKTFLSGTPNYGWFLRSAQTTGTDETSTSFYSRNSKHPGLRPYLKVKFSNALPPLTAKITSPTDGTVVHTISLTVTGTVSDSTATVAVNGAAASLSEGTFEASVTLSEGSNRITAEAKDGYGQAASDSITVSLVSRGTLAGTVSDFQSALPLASATVSVTDSQSITQAASTGADGKYSISDIRSGPFTGTVAKEGYNPHSLSGTMIPGQTVTMGAALAPIIPTISNVAVSGITSDSATITWDTDQLADSRVDYGATTSYGNFVSDSTLVTSHGIILTGLAPSTTYHFKVLSTNTYGFSSSSGDSTFLTLVPQAPLVLSIDSPKAGANLSKSKIMVKGTVSQENGLETGVVVNGRVAVVTGNHFIANRVPLEEGQNQITAVATDVNGNTETASVTVNVTLPGHYIRLTANIESGIAPLETILTLDTSLDPTRLSVTYIGPADVEFLSTSESEYRLRLTTEGTYFFTAEGTDSAGVSYNDTVALTVLSKEALDTLLRAKWEGMRQKLGSQNLQEALAYFVGEKKELYNEVFTALYQKLPGIFQEMQDIQLVYAEDSAVKYRIRRNEFHAGQMVDITYYIYFVRDRDGLWRIYRF